MISFFNKAASLTVDPESLVELANTIGKIADSTGDVFDQMSNLYTQLYEEKLWRSNLFDKMRYALTLNVQQFENLEEKLISLEKYLRKVATTMQQTDESIKSSIS